MPPEYITVTAPPERVTPVHTKDGVDPAGGGQLRVTSDTIARVRYAGSQCIRRSIARGDLIMCDMNGAKVDSADLAACPNELPGGKIKRPQAVGKAKP